MTNIYGGRDPREVPAYSVSMAAYLLDVSDRTLRTWVVGRSYPKQDGEGRSQPLIFLPSDSAYLSFINLVEAHVLKAIRKRYKVPLPNVRRALVYLRQHSQLDHPLVQQEFKTDGVDLFINSLGSVVNVSRGGQLALRELIETYLQRVERDESGLPVRLFPFARDSETDVRRLAAEPRGVMIDPRISFGKPVISGTGIPTATVAERYKAGEDIEELADDFAREPQEIQEAIRYELRLHQRAA